MSITPPSNLSGAPAGVAATFVPPATAKSPATGVLLQSLREESATASRPAQPVSATGHENRLAMVRLGMASSLFYALRAKHPATAAHSLRVALSVSAWCERLGSTEAMRDRVEVAALLHNIGKIGIPDRILRKPGKLDDDERLTVDLTPQIAVEILRGCTGDTELLNIIRYRNQWFATRRDDDGPIGQAIPFGSRMLAIAGAFDAMTTDTVYRSALSREAALGELLGGSGTQFDPDLTDDFVRMLEDRPEILQGKVANRWLHTLKSGSDSTVWSTPVPGHSPTANAASALGDELLDHWLQQTDAGIIFTDTEGTVLQFNRRISLLTGVQPEAMVGQRLSTSELSMRCPEDEARGEALVPRTIAEGSEILMMEIDRGDRGVIPVEVRSSRIQSAGHYNRGVLIEIRDLSDEMTLQEELNDLHQKSVTDPLTKVSNRAHFDETLAKLIEVARRRKTTLSLVICDIDHFKKVNDVHGHQAGDEALVSFAKVLQSHAREGDLVARYGGEEFLLLAPSCDINAMTRRAEAIRATLETTPLPSLDNESVTASFGVTQLQSGDSADTVVARADRALLKAKDNGRNRVIQLGSGNSFETVEKDNKPGWREWLSWGEAENSEFDILTPVPVDLAIEKLRGFISDHKAEIVTVKENQVTVTVATSVRSSGRRRSDTQILLRVSLTLSERAPQEGSKNKVAKTNVHVLLEPIRNRDRRGHATRAAFRKATDSLRSYLMGEVSV